MLAGNLLKLVTLAAISTIAMAHSRMSKPIPRNPNGLGGQFSGSSIPNCEASRGQPKATYQRGQQIDINWARNNHYGGFIRLSIVPLANSDTNGIFDIPDNFEQFHCHESVCGPAEPLDPNGMFGGDPPGKNQPYQNTCSKTFTIPAHLADGEYTIQWLWYGGSNHYGKGNEMEGHYVTCHDFTVGGGAPYKPRPTGTCPVYKGGDVHQNGDKCLYLYETSPTCTVSSETEDGDILWDCGGQTSNLKANFGYPYPDLFKTCTKSTKKRSGGHGHGHRHGLTNITLYEEIEVVQGLDKYYS